MVFRHLSAVSKVAMLENTQGKITAGILRLLPARAARRFARQQDGAAAVEFALVALPFLALTFAILETALVFFAGQTLEAAVSDTARLIMTGQAQTQGFSQADFKNQVCARLAGGLFDCANGVYVNVKTFTSYGTVNTAPTVNNGQFDTTTMGYNAGSPGCIVAVSVFYQWPIYVSLLGDNLSNLGNGTRLLEATSVFRNEPYGPAGAC
jgi:Flp pilus assembly protein TadG